MPDSEKEGIVIGGESRGSVRIRIEREPGIGE
jgi:hypothetical protein